ncbi:unnamed protein product [Durusdinium trenchii]|uniref:Apple domain-containing protein n=1 Tax=Durusdinium trenchii TaxID=1381693 RepID=A0ABP0N743_9DINO
MLTPDFLHENYQCGYQVTRTTTPNYPSFILSSAKVNGWQECQDRCTVDPSCECTVWALDGTSRRWALVIDRALGAARYDPIYSTFLKDKDALVRVQTTTTEEERRWIPVVVTDEDTTKKDWFWEMDRLDKGIGHTALRAAERVRRERRRPVARAVRSRLAGHLGGRVEFGFAKDCDLKKPRIRRRKRTRRVRKRKRKDDEKEKKRAERAETWNCERGDAVRQIGALLQLDAAVEEELDGVFEAIDEGETVRIDGLQNKQARKKLRHLLQAFRLTQEENGQAYRSCELKVSFKSIYQECLIRAKEHFVAKPVDVEEPEEEEPDQAEPEAFDPRAGYSGEAEEAEAAPPAARIRGPQLPGATVGASELHSGSESDGEAGPRGEGEEREGVDLRYADPVQSGREEWMTMAPESNFQSTNLVERFAMLSHRCTAAS